MGNARWNTGDFDAFARRHTRGRRAEEVFGSRGPRAEFDPRRFPIRESRDSPANPLSTPIALFSDVTGSMGETAEIMIRQGLDTVMREVDRRRPVSDPHLLVGAVGDTTCDRAPIQMTQFEAGVVLAEQLGRLWIEGGGGGNRGESYLAAHFAAGVKTSTDAWEKRGRKGFLFTMGDEPNLPVLAAEHIERVFGLPATRDLTAAECLGLARQSYEVFHIVFTGVGYASGNLPGVLATWRPLLGERVILLDDHTKVAEIVVSTLQLMAGETVNDVAASWEGSTAMTVANALQDLSGGLAGTRRTRRFGFL